MAINGIAAAFGLVLLAGLCAPLGACVVLVMKRSHRQLLSGCIALAAGVMVFVSLTEVLGDSLQDLLKGGMPVAVAHTVLYLGFFGGIIVCGCLDYVTDNLLRVAARFSSNEDSSADSSVHIAGAPKQGLLGKDVELQDHNSITLDAQPTDSASAHEIGIDIELQEVADAMQSRDIAQLKRTSLLIGLALTFHNIPEGLATFVGYMSSPHLGVTIAIAIAVHNIPEGIAIGVPIFFATGSKWKAIGWAALTGIAEPLGALIGLAIQMSGQLNPLAMGIIMSLVAGIMTGVAFRELVPRALHYDPTNRYATHGMFAGMGIMAASLVLLGLWDKSE